MKGWNLVLTSSHMILKLIPQFCGSSCYVMDLDHPSAPRTKLPFVFLYGEGLAFKNPLADVFQSHALIPCRASYRLSAAGGTGFGPASVVTLGTVLMRRRERAEAAGISHTPPVISAHH
ncbi:hypothetical protein SKAU_G00215650 [Synaphobranchus kaupii]|uniref:Uncharacterized protein n=1 Tax=Synaphobranchus kaupii TaxID=118154 RepID=A0A9Q1FA77_SYNKA|nr:hypothetical protein SKAU_G00215650 [Synaphobranchus kaupii]